MNSRLDQIRFDALTADFIYTKKLNELGAISKAINFLTVIFPVLILALTSLAKGSCYEGIFNFLSFLVGAVLLCLSIWSFVSGYESKKERYLLGRRENKFIASEALKFIESQKNDSDLTWFYHYVQERDSSDSDNIEEFSEELRQEAYRDSLKKQIPGREDVVCSFCKASPFRFKKGDCQVCGNTIKEEK